MTHFDLVRLSKHTMRGNVAVGRAVVCLTILLFPRSGRGENESSERHLFVQRDRPLPGSPKKLFKIEHGFPSRFSGHQNVHEVFHRAQRSLNSDMKPEATVVRLYAVVRSLKSFL